MTDLVERLRDERIWGQTHLRHEAADEIERLRAVVDAARVMNFEERMSDQDTYSFTAHIVVMRNGLTKEDAATEILEFMLDHDMACSLHEEADEIERLREVEKKYRWLRSRASYEARHHEYPPYAWTIRFRSTCSTPENAIKKAALENDDE